MQIKYIEILRKKITFWKNYFQSLSSLFSEKKYETEKKPPWDTNLVEEPVVELSVEEYGRRD